MQIGSTLRKAREELGLSLEEVEDSIKIRKRYLDALEKEAFDMLPGQFYIKSFLRNYTEFLGINPEPLVALLEEHLEVKEDFVRSTFITKENGCSFKRFNWRILACSVMVVFIILLIFGMGFDFCKDTSPQMQSSSLQDLTPQIEEKSRQKSVNLVLDVKKDKCWMQVIVDGKDRFTGELQANQSKSFSGKERIEVKLGNAGVVQVRVDGRNLGYLGRWGEVVKREFYATKG